MYIYINKKKHSERNGVSMFIVLDFQIYRAHKQVLTPINIYININKPSLLVQNFHRSHSYSPGMGKNAKL